MRFSPKRTALVSLGIAGAATLAAYRPLGCSNERDPRANVEPNGTKKPDLGKARGSSEPFAQAALLCSALHGEPARRRAECCNRAGASLFHDECVRHLSAALKSRAVRVDSNAIARCEAAVKREVVGCDWIAPTLPSPPAACRGVVIGTVTEGGNCRSSLECEGELHCEGQGASSAGVCRKPQPISAHCGVGVDPLATYLSERDLEGRKPSCIDQCSLVTHRCEARPEPGTACRASVNCARDQRCHDGRCETRVAGTEGTACDGASCAPEHRCVAGRCTARALSGEVCRSDLDCAVGGCVASEDGRKACGMKCESALGALIVQSSAKALGLGAHAESTSR